MSMNPPHAAERRDVVTSGERLYLDANATEPLRPMARAALTSALDLPGNPASIHTEGRAARRALETAREIVAGRFGAQAQNVVFCSGATEANALAIHAFGRNDEGAVDVLVGATEHEAVRAPTAIIAPGAMIIPVDTAGLVDLAWLDAALAVRRGALVCVMAANNETGVISPIAEVAALCAARGAVLHVDAVQAAGRVDLQYFALGVASIALSAHKLGGPKGAGALIVTPAVANRLTAMMAGGGQERGRRGGTQDLAAIVGFGAALSADRDRESARVMRLRDAIEAGARAIGAAVIGAAAPRLPNTTCLALPGMAAATQVIGLDMAGIAVSAGSACSSGKVGRSAVLAAMGLDDVAGCAIRVSLPWNVPDDSAMRFIAAYRRLATHGLQKRDEALNSVRKLSSSQV